VKNDNPTTPIIYRGGNIITGQIHFFSALGRSDAKMNGLMGRSTQQRNDMITQTIHGCLADGTQITDELLPIIQELQQFQHYLIIPNLPDRLEEKRAGLRSLGFGEDEIEKYCSDSKDGWQR